MTMSLAGFCNRPLNLQRAGTTQSPSGAAVKSFTTYNPGVLFAVSPASDEVVQLYARRDARVDYVLWTVAALPAGSVRENDRAVDPVTGETFVVLGTKRYQNGQVCGGITITELHCATLND